MKITAPNAFVLLAGIVAIMLVTGCEEQQQTSSYRLARLAAAENIQLKKDLQQRDMEIEKLKEQHDKEMKNQQELLKKCQQQKGALEEQLGGKFEAQLNKLFKGVSEENTKLREENKNLKAQIEKLHHQLDLRPKPKPMKPDEEP